ncbi:MAG: glycosyltransferase [Candidatus Sungbacteria bacterium]|nr:glycosyltransferase [Candidatus Sungbacteria bacterium]
MRVLCVTQFSEIGGTSRLHALQFFPHLERDYGMQISKVAIYSDRFFRMQMDLAGAGRKQKFFELAKGLLLGFFKKVILAFRAARYDVVFIQRETFPVFLYRILRVMNPHVAYQLEDAIYEISPFLGGKSFLHRLLLRYQAHLCRRMMRGAAVVIAENEGIATEARKHNTRVVIISAPIDSDRFRPISHAYGVGPVTIGWIGSPATTRLLATIDPVFSALGAKYGARVRLKTVGAARDYTAPGIAMEKKDWSFDTEVADLQSFDIGIMPLEDTPFEKGRLGGKMIFYMMTGVPFVASDAPLNRGAADDGVHGFFVSTHEQWVEKLSLLIEDAALRSRMGGQGRLRAKERFSLKSKIPLLADALKQAVA